MGFFKSTPAQIGRVLRGIPEIQGPLSGAWEADKHAPASIGAMTGVEALNAFGARVSLSRGGPRGQLTIKAGCLKFIFLIGPATQAALWMTFGQDARVIKIEAYMGLYIWGTSWGNEAHTSPSLRVQEITRSSGYEDWCSEGWRNWDAACAGAQASQQ